jgi:uncharacterized protein GlcG (DUF336 family)
MCDIALFTVWKGANAVRATVAQGQAAASAGFGQPSGALVADSPVIPSIIAILGGACCRPRGAVPIYKHGKLVGALGGSGAAAQQDEVCAYAGEAALERLHNGDMVRAYGPAWILRQVAPSGDVLSTVR